jgi:hypothetical protein
MQSPEELELNLSNARRYLVANPCHPYVHYDIQVLESKLRHSMLPAEYWAVHSEPGALETQLGQVVNAWRTLFARPADLALQARLELLNDHLLRSVLAPAVERGEQDSSLDAALGSIRF